MIPHIKRIVVAHDGENIIVSNNNNNNNDNNNNDNNNNCCRASAGSTHILERFEIFLVRWFDGSMVQWFHGSISKVTNEQVLSCRACFSLLSNPPFCFVLM